MGRLPLDADFLRGAPSGDVFGLSQDAGMGWEPDGLRGKEYLILSTLGVRFAHGYISLDEAAELVPVWKVAASRGIKALAEGSSAVNGAGRVGHRPSRTARSARAQGIARRVPRGQYRPSRC